MAPKRSSLPQWRNKLVPQWQGRFGRINRVDRKMPTRTTRRQVTPVGHGNRQAGHEQEPQSEHRCHAAASRFPS